jgi:metal-dependent amidase/aminoacylase/carboxypeptidase family protein
MPHEVVDPSYITSHIILALHGIVSRRLRLFEPAVLSVGTNHGGEVDYDISPPSSHALLDGYVINVKAEVTWP